MKRLIFATCLLLAACGKDSDTPSHTYDAAGTPAKGDVYVSASLGKAAGLVPYLAGESASSEIAGLIYNSLISYDKDLNFKAELAEKWHVSEDGLTFTFNLRKDVKWHDGEPFTAHDALATFNALTNPNTRTPYAGDYLAVKKAVVVDEHTFQVTYPEPFAPALASWATFTVLPAHIIENEEDFNKTSLKEKPVGTGPYKLVYRNADTEHRLMANADYFDGEPAITMRRIRVIPDQDTQFLELKAGNLDSMGLKPVQFTRLTDGAAFTNTYNKYKYLSNGYTYVGFKLNHPIFKDKLVRQALSYATPREQIIKGVNMGQGEAICCPLKPGTWAFNENLKPYPYDIEKAKNLLAQAGWADTNGNGIVDKDGREFSFTLITNQGNDQRIKTAEILQQYWKKLGVEVKVQVQEWSTFIANTINKRQFEAFILGWSLSIEPDPYDIWHSSKTGEKEFNIVGFNNAEADALMIKSRRTFDQAERKKHLDRFQEILDEEQPYLFLYAPHALIATHKRIKGIKPAPAGIGYNFDKWYVPASQHLRKVEITQ